MEKLTVMELSLMCQAFFHKYVSYTRSAHLQKEGPMCFSLLEGLVALSFTQNIGLAFQIRVLSIDGLNLFSRVDPAGSDRASHHCECLFLDAFLPSNHCCPPCFFLKVSLC